MGGKIEQKIDSSEKLSKARDKVQKGFGKLLTKMGFKKEQPVNPDGFE